MQMLTDYWYVWLGIIAVLIIAIYAAMRFFNLPTKEQVAKIKEVLLVWVIQAEKELGAKTGQIKLRYVYDLFVSRFPGIAKVVKFETFSGWVDEALAQMNSMLQANKNLEEYVEK